MSETPNSDMYHTVPKAVVVELEKQLAAATAERDALLQDKARLDWLEETRLDHRAQGEENEWLWASWAVETDDELVEDIRTAIDAAKGGEA